MSLVLAWLRVVSAGHTLEGSSPLWLGLELTHHPVRNITHPVIYMHVVNVSYIHTPSDSECCMLLHACNNHVTLYCTFTNRCIYMYTRLLFYHNYYNSKDSLSQCCTCSTSSLVPRLPPLARNYCVTFKLALARKNGGRAWYILPRE